MNRLLQVVIALVGIAITGVLGFASQRSDSLQTRHTLLGNFTEAVSAARATCDGDLMFMALGTLEELERQEARPRVLQTPADQQDQAATRELIRNYRDRVAEMQTEIDTGTCASATAVATGAITPAPAPGAVAPVPAPAPVTRSMTAPTAQLRLPATDAIKATANSELRRAESSVARVARVAPNLRDAPAEGYYVVLGSYDVNAPTSYANAGVAADYRRLRAAIPASEAKLEVYRTSISDHFVIVLAPTGLERDAARDLMSTARARGWATDAFVQARRGWTQCPQPERITTAASCAGERTGK